MTRVEGKSRGGEHVACGGRWGCTTWTWKGSLFILEQWETTHRAQTDVDVQD